MRKLIAKIMKRFGYKKLSIEEMKLLSVGLHTVQHYINDRKFRRTLKDQPIGDAINQIIHGWKADK